MKAIENWQTITLGEVCKFTGGNGFPDELQGLKDGDYPFIKVSDMELPGNKKTIVEANNWIDEKTRANEAFKAFPKDSVIFAKVGAALLLNRRRILTRPTCIDNNMMAAVPTGIDPLFLFYKLSDIDFADFVQSGAVPSVNQGQLSTISFGLPQSKPEQVKLAEILSTVDRAVEQTEALIAKQQRIMTGLMQELLTRGIDEHGNLRSERTHKFKDSPLGRIPVEWDVKRLEECVDFWDGKRIPLKQEDRDAMEGDYPYYGASGIIDYIDRYLFDDNLILIGEDGENVVSRNLPLAFRVTGKIWVNNHAHVLKPKGDHDIDFFVERLEFYDYSLLVSGSAQPKLNQRSLWQMQLPIPEATEQKRIGHLFTKLKEDHEGRTSGLMKLRSLKTALMQDLLTGKKRVTSLLEQKEVVS